VQRNVRDEHFANEPRFWHGRNHPESAKFRHFKMDSCYLLTCSVVRVRQFRVREATSGLTSNGAGGLSLLVVECQVQGTSDESVHLGWMAETRLRIGCRARRGELSTLGRGGGLANGFFYA